MIALGDILITQWKRIPERTEVTNWLAAEYLSDPWLTWNVGAPGKPGVPVDQQSIESDNLQGKKYKWGKTLRASTEQTLTVNVPSMVHTDSLDMTNVPLTRHCDVVSNDLLLKAKAIVDNKLFLKIVESEAETSIYMNATFRCSDTEPVTKPRIKDYRRGLSGEVNKKVKTVKQYIKTHMSLHRVQCIKSACQPDPQKVAYDYLCDCKGFLRTVTCSHELAAQQIMGEIKIQTLLEPLARRTKKGNRGKTRKACEKQPNESVRTAKKSRRKG